MRNEHSPQTEKPQPLRAYTLVGIPGIECEGISASGELQNVVSSLEHPPIIPCKCLPFMPRDISS